MFGSEVIWNGVPFGYLRGVNMHLPVMSFDLNEAVKLEADEETGMTKVTGRELQTCEFTVHAVDLPNMDDAIRANPMIIFRALDMLRGMSGGIYLADGASATLSRALLDALQTSDWRKLLTVDNALELAKSLLIGEKMGGVEFLLHSVTLDAQGTHANGKVYDGLITLSFTEDAGQSQTGGLIVYVNDKDVTSSIALHAGLYETHAEGQADCLIMEFADTKGEWAKWKPSDQGDTVKLTDGAIRTGKMYIDKIEPQGGTYKLTAYSIPKKLYSTKSRSFTAASLPTLAQKIAKEHGLECKSYNVPEVALSYTSQKAASDLAFLQRQCEKNSCAFLVYNGALCIYSQAYIEGREPTKTLTPDFSAEFTVTSDAQAKYASCELRNGTYTGTASDSSVTTGKVFRESVTSAWSSQADANAEAASRLRTLNRGTTTAELDMPIQRQLMAGSVVRLICKGWTGSAFVYRCRHDLGAKRSHIWLRKPLSY